MNTRKEIGYYLKNVITVAIYIAFFYFVVMNILKAENASIVVFNVLIGVFVGGFAVLYEIMRFFYDAATKALIVDCDPDKCLALLNRVKKIDFIKSFTTSIRMMKMLCYVDKRDYESLEALLKEVDAEEKKDYDVEIVSAHSKMVMYGEASMKGKMNEAFKYYEKLRDMKNNRGKRYKGAYFFNNDLVLADHKMYEKDPKGALNYLKDITSDNMNKREAMHFHLSKTRVYKSFHMDYQEEKELALKVTGKNAVMREYIESL